jgi:hypothetical protein
MCVGQRPTERVCPSLQTKNLKLKKGDIKVRAGGGGVLTAVVWTDKRYDYMLNNRNQPPAQGNLLVITHIALKLNIVEFYNKHVGFVD